MVQIGSAVGYADSERTVEQSSLDGSSGRCGEGLLVILTTERSGLPYIYIDVTKVKVRHTGTGMLASQ